MRATVGTGQVTIRWARPAEVGRTPISSYVIKTFLKATPKKLLKQFKVKGNVFKYIAKTLPKKKAIQFKVYAVNAGGTSPASATVTATITK